MKQNKILWAFAFIRLNTSVPTWFIVSQFNCRINWTKEACSANTLSLKFQNKNQIFFTFFHSFTNNSLFQLENIPIYISLLEGKRILYSKIEVIWCSCCMIRLTQLVGDNKSHLCTFWVLWKWDLIHFRC